jgi:DnaJ-class molecular chaperone
MASESKTLDLYAVLGGCESDSYEELRARYRAAVLKAHPDKLEARGRTEGNADEFRRLQSAWEVLGNQEKRREYDLHIETGMLSCMHRVLPRSSNADIPTLAQSVQRR